MHIVALAWLYVILLVALTMRSVLAGVVLFIVAGLAPVLACATFAAHRLRSRKRSDESMLEQPVNRSDDGDAKPDQ